MALSMPTALLASGALASAGAQAPSHAPAHSLLQSRQLWATVNVCNPKDQPNWIGIRGSMPGDGHANQTMYMRFRVQYRDPASGKWVDVAQGADSGFLALGSAAKARQSGHSFQLVPVAGKPAFQLRGTVSFQWRQGARVLHSMTRPTSTGHKSLAGADPAGFTAATCTLG